eukprot:GFKZ01009579.1.p1 GENE.GFKZ01009579.1~~GFKZ01009579.1.p1  ORF type:complete len:948 (+),score=174.39 GFKZ01009579.1:246-3089(+)
MPATRAANPRQARQTYIQNPTPLRPTFTHGSPKGTPHTKYTLVSNDSSLTLLSPSNPPRSLPLLSTNLASEDVTSALALSPDASIAVQCLRSGRVHIIHVPSRTIHHTLRPFRDRAVVSLAHFDASGCFVALGTADGHVRIYDIRNADVTHVFRITDTMITSMLFHPNPEEMALVLGCEDGSVLVCPLQDKAGKARLRVKKHVGAIGGMAFAEGGRVLVTVSVDRLVCFVEWKDGEEAKLVNSGERLMAVVAMEGVCVATVGERGLLRKWDSRNGREIGEGVKIPFVTGPTGGQEEEDEEEEEGVLPVGMTLCGDSELAIALSDQTLVYVGMEGRVNNVVCGNLQEIYGVRVLEASGGGKGRETREVREFALASNSATLWIMRMATDSEGSGNGRKELDAVMVDDKNVSLKDDETAVWSVYAGLQGHTGIILCVDALTNEKDVGKTNLGDAFLATSSRDKSARVWRRNQSTGRWRCIGLAEGHTDAIGAVALSKCNAAGGFYMVTGAADRTLKLWSLGAARRKADKIEGVDGMDTVEEGVGWAERIRHCSGEDDAVVKLEAKWTKLGHDKDINAVGVSPDGRVIATGSQDRTVKLWDAEKGQLRVTCRGHKRGIWDVRFSTVDKVVASSSGDKTIRVWGVVNGECLRVYQGHQGGVLRCLFMSGGTQIVSCGADGMMKVWRTKTGECLGTFDGHEDRVWGLESVGDGDLIVTGGADGRVCLWRDGTEEKLEQEREKKRMEVEIGQEVENAARGRKWTTAVRGALKLGMTDKLRGVLMDMIERSGDDREEKVVRMVKEIYEKTKEEEGEKESWRQVTKLLLCCRDWNAGGGGRNSGLAGYVMKGILCVFSPETLMRNVTVDGKGLVEGLVAHCDRHLERLGRVERDLALIEYMLERAEGVGELDERKEGKGANEMRAERTSKKEGNGDKSLNKVRRKRRKREDVDMEY